MKSVRKLRGFLGSRSLKIRKKNDYAKPWKSALNSYGDSKINKDLLRSAFLGKLKKYLRLPWKERSFVCRSEKRKIYGLRAAKIVGFTALFVLTLAALRNPALQYAGGLDLFRIKEIGVSGCILTDRREILEITGLDYKTSMFGVSTSQVVDYINSHPWIQSAEVNKVWPDTIYIEVKEHRAAALLVSGIPGQEKLMYLNRLGETIAPVKKGDDLDYPVITGLNTGSSEEHELALAEAVSFLKLISYNNPNLPAQSVSEIHFDQDEGLIIRLVDFPFPIYFGRGEINKKYRQLRNVLSVLYNKRKKGVDISEVEYIRMEYLEDKVLVAQSNSG